MSSQNNNDKIKKNWEKERFAGFEKALENIRKEKKAGNKGLWEFERTLLAIQNEKDETTRHLAKAQYDKLMSPGIEERYEAVRREHEIRTAWMSNMNIVKNKENKVVSDKDDKSLSADKICNNLKKIQINKMKNLINNLKYFIKYIFKTIDKSLFFLWGIFTDGWKRKMFCMEVKTKVVLFYNKIKTKVVLFYNKIKTKVVLFYNKITSKAFWKPILRKIGIFIVCVLALVLFIQFLRLLAFIKEYFFGEQIREKERKEKREQREKKRATKKRT